MTFFYIDWVATICSLVAAYLIGNQQRNGFLLFMFGNLAWIAVGGLTHSVAIIIGNVMFFLLNLRAYHQCGKGSGSSGKLCGQS